MFFNSCLHPSFNQYVTGFVVMMPWEGSKTKGNKTNDWPSSNKKGRLSGDYQKTLKLTGCCIYYQVHGRIRKKSLSFLLYALERLSDHKHMGNLSLVIHIYTTLPVHSCLGGLKEVSEETSDMINCTQLNMLDKIILAEKYLFHLMCFKYYSENRVSMF